MWLHTHIYMRMRPGAAATDDSTYNPFDATCKNKDYQKLENQIVYDHEVEDGEDSSSSVLIANIIKAPAESGNGILINQPVKKMDRKAFWEAVKTSKAYFKTTGLYQQKPGGAYEMSLINMYARRICQSLLFVLPPQLPNTTARTILIYYRPILFPGIRKNKAKTRLLRSCTTTSL